MRYCVLASGSSGNASLLTAGGFGALLDIGLGPRALARRLAAVGASWDDVHAVFLTHVHGDHWNENTLAHLRRRHIPLYCHPSHATALKVASDGFADLLDNDAVHFYEVDHVLQPAASLSCRPLLLKHDSGITCGFRFEGRPDIFSRSWALAYAADLGSWNDELAEALANVDVLALEFNHDEYLERHSGRSLALIQRVLGDHGHLSNEQAAGLLREVLARSESCRLQHLVQLHLSRDCNRPALARQFAHAVCREQEHEIKVHTAEQNYPGAWLGVRRPAYRVKKERGSPLACAEQQPWLPGWDV